MEHVWVLVSLTFLKHPGSWPGSIRIRNVSCWKSILGEVGISLETEQSD